ncbi:MAG: glycosyltransferase family 39 protein, partial [Anaerolineae bacterium]|nr:glycosyltransferase family 39 protein [Anaerolineae bacterium]
MRQKRPGPCCVIASLTDAPDRAAHVSAFSRLRVSLPLLIILIAVWLRAPAVWSAAPFDVDEALYATYGRQISHENNPLLAEIPIDKPPLHFYTLAFSFKLFIQPSQWAARLPAFFASLLTVAAVWRLTLTLYRARLTAVMAALLVALSPLDVTYATTAFVDVPVTFWIALALVAISRGSWGLSAALAALAFSTKQSAVIFVPLILAVGIVVRRPRPAQFLRFVLICGIACALPFAWDIARPGDITGWWALGAANNAPDRLSHSHEILPRLQTWGRYLSSGIGSLWGLVAALAGALSAIWAGRHANSRRRAYAFDLIWLAYCAGYSLLYSLIAFNLYPRYAHFLIVPLAILAARVTTRALTLKTSRRVQAAVAAVLLITFGAGLPDTFAARTDPEWLRPARERHAGIEATAAYL